MSWILLAIYQCLATAGFILAGPYLLYRAVRHPREMGERLGWPADLADRPLWIHAASLGELEAVRGLLEHTEEEFAPPLLLTVLSVSARRRFAAEEGCAVRFAPADLWFALLPFLARVRPRGLILVETELWPCTLAFCRLFKVRVALVSGRLSARKWNRTRRLRVLLGPLLRAVERVGVQGEEDAKRFSWMGAQSVRVTGNLKYRMSGPEARRPAGARVAPFLFVAGSVRIGEEAVLEAAADRMLLLLAPRHLREREHWLDECRRRGLGVAARSELDPSANHGRSDVAAAVNGGAGLEPLGARLRKLGVPVLLLDTHGELAFWYAAGDAAFVGGTLVPIGGHNLFEPARCGVPVAFGPHTEGVADVAGPLLRLGGGFRVRNGAELRAWVERMRTDAVARAAAASGARAAAEEVAGGVRRTWRLLQELEWTRVRERASFAGRPVAQREPRSAASDS